MLPAVFQAAHLQTCKLCLSVSLGQVTPHSTCGRFSAIPHARIFPLPLSSLSLCLNTLSFAVLYYYTPFPTSSHRYFYGSTPAYFPYPIRSVFFSLDLRIPFSPRVFPFVLTHDVQSPGCLSCTLATFLCTTSYSQLYFLRSPGLLVFTRTLTGVGLS